MHCKAECSDRFLRAVTKVCKILLKFFLAEFQYCLFKLELGWYSSFLFNLPKLVVPPHNLPVPRPSPHAGRQHPDSQHPLTWLRSRRTQATSSSSHIATSNKENWKLTQVKETGKNPDCLSHFSCLLVKWQCLVRYPAYNLCSVNMGWRKELLEIRLLRLEVT